MQTKGEYRVGITFNPSADDTVSRIKRMAADLIDAIEVIGANDSDDKTVPHVTEVHRLKALAQTHVEDAAMWAVKAATKGAP